jgi:carbonic anhydrase
MHRVSLFLISSCILFSVLNPIKGDDAVHLLDYTESNWGAACKTGVRQTPINIVKSTTKDGSNYFEVLMANYTLVSNTNFKYEAGYKYRADLPNQGYIIVKKEGYTYGYQLFDMHIHATSEHSINDNFADMELHLVHKKVPKFFETFNPGITTDPDAVNTLLVVGILFKGNGLSDNPDIAKMDFKSFSSISNLDLAKYPKNTKAYFHYIGGLTTPDCNEIVNWVVMEQIETMSPAQLSVIKKWISAEYPNGNARATKPLNGRTVYYIPAFKTVAHIDIKEDPIASSASTIKNYNALYFFAFILILLS